MCICAFVECIVFSLVVQSLFTLDAINKIVFNSHNIISYECRATKTNDWVPLCTAPNKFYNAPHFLSRSPCFSGSFNRKMISFLSLTFVLMLLMLASLFGTFQCALHTHSYVTMNDDLWDFYQRVLFNCSACDLWIRTMASSEHGRYSHLILPYNSEATEKAFNFRCSTCMCTCCHDCHSTKAIFWRSTYSCSDARLLMAFLTPTVSLSYSFNIRRGQFAWLPPSLLLLLLPPPRLSDTHPANEHDLNCHDLKQKRINIFVPR